MKFKTPRAVIFGVITSIAGFALADSSVYNVTLNTMVIYKDTTTSLPGALLSYASNGQPSACYLNILHLTDLTDPVQKEMYATLVGLKLNNTLIQALSFASNCKITNFSF